MYDRRVNVSKLVRLRAVRGWSMAELARRSGVSYSMLKYIHWGQKEPSDVIAEKIAQALEVHIEAFTELKPRDERVFQDRRGRRAS